MKEELPVIPSPATPETPPTDWCPVYEKDGNEFVILSVDFRADSEEDAWKIGMGSMLVECVLWQMKYTRVVPLNRKLFPHRKAAIQGCPVAIISGPWFNEVAEGTAYANV